MIVSILYVLLAILGLSFLIFLHELGHYFMARRVGMRIETFAIGFGKPIFSWERKGVKWQIGWLLFGGYVKIAGEDPRGEIDPHDIPDGFFGKRPIDRIKVAFAGPFVNLVLAFLFFVVIWATGGREKNFAEFTHKIGWVDPKSDLFISGIRPGDEIISYNDQSFTGAKDHLYAAMMNGEGVIVKGDRVDYVTHHKEPFELTVKPYSHPSAVEKGIMTTGIIGSANYIFYAKLPNGEENPLPEGSPMLQSGIQYGDRIVWADGDLVFSGQQLAYLLNDDRVLLTIFRKGNRLLVRVPRILMQELKMDPAFKEEMTDWKYEAGLNNVKIQKLYALPYSLTNDCVVEGEMRFIDKENQTEAFPAHPYSSSETPLQPKDKIIAIDGAPVKTSYELLAKLQEHRVNIIVERNPALFDKISSRDADGSFDKEINWNDVSAIANSIGTGHEIRAAGDYVLLNAIVPKMRNDFELSPEKQAWLAAELLEHKKELEKIDDPEKRTQALALFKTQEKQLLLGLPGVQDRKVNYNPSPVAQFEQVFSEIWRTLKALVTGSLNPKWISGPIGIVQVVHDNWKVGIKEALFWLGAISLNLGILNLLPIPVLDGGTILLSFLEMISGRRLSPKTLEKLILPFALILIAFFIFLTYQDLSRLLHGLLHW
ncbi:MAG: site-2 protease family protein [Parachlamydiaceae bacterium]